MEYRSKNLMMRSPESPEWEKGGNQGREVPSPGLPAATTAAMMEEGGGGHLYKNSKMTAASLEVRKIKVMEKERGGHLYKKTVQFRQCIWKLEEGDTSMKTVQCR